MSNESSPSPLSVSKRPLAWFQVFLIALTCCEAGIYLDWTWLSDMGIFVVWVVVTQALIQWLAKHVIPLSLCVLSMADKDGILCLWSLTVAALPVPVGQGAMPLLQKLSERCDTLNDPVLCYGLIPLHVITDGLFLFSVAMSVLTLVGLLIYRTYTWLALAFGPRTSPREQLTLALRWAVLVGLDAAVYFWLRYLSQRNYVIAEVVIWVLEKKVPMLVANAAIVYLTPLAMFFVAVVVVWKARVMVRQRRNIPNLLPIRQLQ